MSFIFVLALKMVKGLPEAAVVLDSSMKAVFYNSAYLHLVGVRRHVLDDLLAKGISPLNILGRRMKADFKDAEACLRDRQTVTLAHVEFLNVLDDKITASLSFVPLFDESGEGVGVIELIRNHSAESVLQARYKTLLAAEKRRAQDLKSEVEERSRELIKMVKVSGVATFTGGIAQEIDTPLFEINECARALLGQLEDEAQKEILADISSKATRCHQIVEKILEHARDFSAEKVDEININQVLERTCRLFESEIAGEGISLVKSLEEVPTFEGNLYDVRQVLTNLLFNARAAILTKEHSGIIAISTKFDKNHVILEVGDNGCGMSMEQQKGIFDPFYTTKPDANVGLGLLIVKKVVERHQGKVLITSRPHQGTKFSVLFPVSPNEVDATFEE